ncbi:hypothetical protein [Nonomuraea ferruginea]
MAAVVIDSVDQDDIRVALESLRVGKSPRLHWRDEPVKRQFAIAQRLTEMPIHGIVTIYIHDRAVRTERARRRCLERLLGEVSLAGCSEVVIEARSAEQDHLDRGLLTGMRRARTLPHDLVVRWQPSVSEPLLWAADAVVGATTWWLDDRTGCYEMLAPKTRLVCVG